MSENTSQLGEDGVAVSGKSFNILVLGFLLIFAGIIIFIITAMFSGGSGSVGGVVFIGPIPIVFGAGPNSNWLIIISIILAVVMLGLFLVYNRRSRRIRC
jgi:uncharacterized membrane protein